MSTILAAFPGVSTAEVTGQLVVAFYRGFGSFSAIAEKILAQEGLMPLNPANWYRFSSLLSALEAVRSRVGSKTLYQVGLKVPETAMFPPRVNSAQSVLAACPIGYQMNHRNGDTGTMQHTPTGERSGILRVETPYPCPLDEGASLAMALLFEPKAKMHHGSDGCRDQGSRHCTYHISW